MRRLKGIIMIITGGILWGATGPLFEWLLDESKLSVSFIITIRLFISGALLLLVLYFRKMDIFSIWKTPSWRNQLILFSIFGMLGIQYSFVATIQASNAIVATLFQFSAPILIIIYISIIYKMLPPRVQLIGIIGTLFGLFLLMTNGQLGNFLVSKNALLWGVLVGLAFSFYTLYPARLMKDWSVLIVVGWSMLTSGVLLSLITRVWASDGWSVLMQGYFPLVMLLLIIFGTLAFALFLSSMKYISPVEASILSVFEPLTATVISIVWFGTILKNGQFIGMGLMLIFIILLSIGDRKKQKISS